MTERQAAALMKAWLADHGVSDCLHQPFAWFGDRTAFRGLIGVSQLRGFNPAFFPGTRRLQENDPFILDCAPVLDGYTADIGYSATLGENKILDLLMDDLAAHRQLIIEQVRARHLMSEVSAAVDALCVRQGVEPRHHAYPFAVLAHRVEKLPAQPVAPKVSVGRFGIRSVLSLGREAAQGLKEGWSPLWATHQRSAHPPVPGLWAVEPHLGFRGVGAKFEELLVITENDAWWLDDEVPHVQRWIARGVIGAPARAATAVVQPAAATPAIAPATVAKKTAKRPAKAAAAKPAAAPTGTKKKAAAVKPAKGKAGKAATAPARPAAKKKTRKTETA
jgi:Xaa-Pro aminopeptidase